MTQLAKLFESRFPPMSILLVRVGIEPYMADGPEMQRSVKSDIDELKVLFAR